MKIKVIQLSEHINHPFQIPQFLLRNDKSQPRTGSLENCNSVEFTHSTCKR